MKKLKLKTTTKYIQYKRENWEEIYNFIHNNESDFMSHVVEPEGDLILETRRYGFRVRENEWLIILNKKLYRIENDLFNFLFINSATSKKGDKMIGYKDNRHLPLLLSRIENISDNIVGSDRVERMLHLIDVTGFNLIEK